jgi:hypothetical protein
VRPFPLKTTNRSRQGKDRHVRLCLVDCPQQLPKDRTDSWGVLLAMRGMKRQDADAGGQLLKGQQGIPLEFLGYGSGGERRHGVSCDCLQGSHTHGEYALHQETCPFARTRTVAASRQVQSITL